MHSLMPVGFSHVVIYEWLDLDFVVVVVAVVVIKCFMIGVNVWWVYLAPQNIPRAISVLTLGDKVILYIVLYSMYDDFRTSSASQCSAVAFPEYFVGHLVYAVVYWQMRSIAMTKELRVAALYLLTRHMGSYMPSSGVFFEGQWVLWIQGAYQGWR